MTDKKPLEMDVNVSIGGRTEEDHEPGTYAIYEYRIIDAPHIVFEAVHMDPDAGELKIEVTVDGPVEPEVLKNWFNTTIKAIAAQIP